MPKLKDTKKQNVKEMAELLKKLGTSSDKTADKLDNMTSELSKFLQELTGAKDAQEIRRKQNREKRAQQQEEKVQKQLFKERLAAEKKLSQLQEERETIKRKQELEDLRKKGTKFTDIATGKFREGDIIGGLFASLFAIKEPSKKKLRKLEEQEESLRKEKQLKNFNEIEKRTRQTIERLSKPTPAAELSPVKINQTEQQILAEESKVKEEKKTNIQVKEEKDLSHTAELSPVKINQAEQQIKEEKDLSHTAELSPVKINQAEQQILAEESKVKEEKKTNIQVKEEKDLSHIDDTITKVWSKPIDVRVVNSNELFSNIAGTPGSGGGIFGGLGTLAIGGLLAEAGSAILAFLAAPEVLAVLGGTAIIGAVWYGLEKFGYLDKISDWTSKSWKTVKEITGISTPTQPSPSQDIQEELKRQFGDNPAALKALNQVIASESSGNPAAVGKPLKAGGAAAGLFQFTPPTAIRLAKQLKQQGDESLNELIATEGNREQTTKLVANLPVPQQVKMAKEYYKPLFENGNVPDYAQLKAKGFAGSYNPAHPEAVLYNKANPKDAEAFANNPALSEIADKNKGIVTGQSLKDYFEKQTPPELSVLPRYPTKPLKVSQLSGLDPNSFRDLRDPELEKKLFAAPELPEDQIKKYQQWNQSGEEQLQILNDQANELNRHISVVGNPEKLASIEDQIITKKKEIEFNKNKIQQLKTQTPPTSSVVPTPPKIGVNLGAAIENGTPNTSSSNNLLNINNINNSTGTQNSEYISARNPIVNPYNLDMLRIYKQSSIDHLSSNG